MNDKLEQLYNLYKENGLISIDFNTFAAANDSQKKGLYDLGVQQGLFSTTPYETFNSAFSGGQIQNQPAQQQPAQKQYNKLNYQAAPEKPVRSVERQLMSGLENVVPGFEQSMQEKERRIEQNIAKKKEASALDLSLQQDLVESTAKQQQEASSLASQQYETAAEKFPVLRNEFLKDVYQQLQKEQNLPDFVKEQLNQITPDLINLGEYGPGMSSGLALLAVASPLSVASGALSQTVAGFSVEEAVVPKIE